jgi:hypothetical protein
MEKSSLIAWKIVPLRHFFPLKVVPLIEVLLYRLHHLEMAGGKGGGGHQEGVWHVQFSASARRHDFSAEQEWTARRGGGGVGWEGGETDCGSVKDFRWSRWLKSDLCRAEACFYFWVSRMDSGVGFALLAMSR